LHFDGVAVEPADHLDGGAEAWSDGIALTSIAACAEMLGIMGRLFDETLDYLKTRRQFGVPIGSFQVLQHRMARLYIAMEQARSTLLRAVLTPQAQRQSWRRSAMAAKAFFAEAAMRLAEECVQFHGGMGVTDELIVGHGMKRLMLLTRLFGDGASAREAYEALAA
jgi:alkylation response protein AidB-like acyl-CoA dehydrogenase